MKNLGSSIAELFSVLRRMATEEYRGIRNTLLYLLLTFYGLCLLQLLLNGGWFVKIASFIFWVGGVLLLFRVPSLIKIAGLGEILELVRLTQKVPETENQVPKVIENQLSVLVWNLSEKLLFLLTTCCFIIPIYPIRNNPWIIAIFTMTAAIVFLFIWRSKSDWVRPIGLTVSLIFLAINVFSSFPQLSYYTGIEKWMSGIVSAETAEVANKTDELRREQIDKMIRDVHIEIYEWQKKPENKGKNPSEDLNNKLEAAKLGLTVPKYEEKLKAEAEAKAEVEAEASKSTANIPTASATPIENWKLCWQKPDNYGGTTQTKSRCDAVKVEFLEQGFRLEIKAHMFSFVGKRVGENTYEGKWKNVTGEEGDFFLKFSPDFNLATGWEKDPDSQVEIYTWLTKR